MNELFQNSSVSLTDNNANGSLCILALGLEMQATRYAQKSHLSSQRIFAHFS